MSLIYCVEDDASIRELVLYALKASGFEAEGFEDERAFSKGLKKALPSLVLLDVMLPGEDGLTILKRLRGHQETAKLPVIMLTAKSSEYDKVLGLDLGADDYIPKPFGVMELISRVKALLRRTQPPAASSILTLGELSLDNSTRTVTVHGEIISITNKEFSLLYYLISNKGIVLSRERILDSVWNYEYEGESRTVDMHIATLRQKLGSCGRLLETVRGVGYCLRERV